MKTPSVDSMEKYSFSKLEAFHTCQLMWFTRYGLNEKGENNAFAAYGTLVHSIMERYTKGEIERESLADIFEWEFDTAVVEEFPPNKYKDLRESYFQQGIDFLNSFPGYDGYKVLASEVKFELPIDDWIFNGIIDLVFQKENGDIVILDYKSKASFSGKKELAKYARQLYLYSLYIFNTYGVYPTELVFYRFRAQEQDHIQFDKTALEEAVSWAKETVKEIRDAWCYEANYDVWFCNQLCNFRSTCTEKGE